MNVAVVEDDLFQEQACEFLALLEAQRVELVRHGRREFLKPAEKFSAGEGLLLFLLEGLLVAFQAAGPFSQRASPFLELLPPKKATLKGIDEASPLSLRLAQPPLGCLDLLAEEGVITGRTTELFVGAQQELRIQQVLSDLLPDELIKRLRAGV